MHDCRDFLAPANAIYTAHIKPLKDALEKAEEDKAALVVACNVAAENLEHLLIKQPGGTYFFRYKGGTEKCVAFVRAALARVKESSCPKN